MDIIDKYFELVGPVLDSQVMKYMGMDQDQRWETELRLGDMLGHEGLDNIVKDKTKGIVEISQGGYRLRVKITNWDINRADGSSYNVNSAWTLDDIDVLVDPKSTVTLIKNDVTYELGDLYNYSNIDELNIKYNSEDDPIDEDDINEIGYEVQDVISDWLVKEIWHLTGLHTGDIYPSNARPYDLTEQIQGLDIKKFALYADIFEPLHKAFERGDLENGYRELSKQIHGEKQYILDYFYNFIKQNEDYLMSKMNVVESVMRINDLMTDKQNKTN